MSSDDEFDDFLRRRRRLFDRPRDDDLEPPAELDRLVLRQAREAIESEPPHRVFRAPRWGMPVALAATLVLAFTVILHTVKQPQSAPAEVAVRPVARELSAAADSAATAPAAAAEMARAAPAAPPTSNSIVVELADPGADAVPPMADGAPEPNENFALAKQARGEQALVSEAEARRHAEPPPAPIVAGTPAWRRDSKAWMAEIERLRAAGDYARADAELAEFKRQHRAYATSPDQ